MQRREAGLAVLGMLVGLMSALLGIGGGLLLIPALVVFYHQTMRIASGISLVTMWPVIVAGAVASSVLSPQSLQVLVVSLIIAGAFFGTFLGTRCEHRLQNTVLLRLFALLILAAGVLMTLPRGVFSGVLPATKSLLFLVGVTTGFLSGFFGISGGVILVPLLMLLGFPIHTATTTSLLALVGIVFFSAGFHGLSGDINYRVVAFLLPTALLGSLIGSYYGAHAPALLLQGLFVIVLFVTAIRLLHVTRRVPAV